MKRRSLVFALLALSLLAVAPSASAQLLAAKDGPVVYGHHHINTTNAEEQKKFFLGPAPFVLTLMSNPVAARAIEHDDLIRLSKKMGTTVLIAIQVGDTYVHLDQVGESAGPAVLHGVRIRQRRPLR